MFWSDGDACCLEVFGQWSACFDFQLQEEVDGLADRVELANNALKGDWTRWQNIMRNDLKSAFISTAEKNMEYYEKVRAQNFKPVFEFRTYIPVRVDQAI